MPEAQPNRHDAVLDWMRRTVDAQMDMWEADGPSADSIVVHLLEDDTWQCDDCWQDMYGPHGPYDPPAHKWRHLTTHSGDDRYIDAGGCPTCGNNSHVIVEWRNH